MAILTNIISQQTYNEHKQLIYLTKSLISVLYKLPNQINWGESSWAHDIELLDFVRIQVISSENAMKNIIYGYYRESFHLLRMIFESYFTFRLISTCDKYRLYIKINKEKTDTTINNAINRLKIQAKNIFGDKLIEISRNQNSTILTATIRGVPVLNNNKETGVVIPKYYQAWHQFEPVEYHLKKKKVVNKYLTPRFLQGEWAGFPKRKNNLIENYEALHRYYLNFDKMLEHLCLNNVLNLRTATRVLVHYNFLSKFSHCTWNSIQLLSSRKIYQSSRNGLNRIYDHYLSELALLYVCHLLSMFLKHVIFYLRWRKIKLKKKTKMYTALINQVEQEFGYFWFIYNKPHQYDIFDYANRKSDYKKKIFIRPEDIRIRDVRYYNDPLKRLKNLHSSSRELTSGNIYKSPFHRNDALF
jgi:hypothetical protein